MKTYGGVDSRCIDSRCIDPRFLYRVTSWRWVVSFTPQPLYPRGKSPCYPLYGRLDGPQSWSWRHGEVRILNRTGTRTPIPQSFCSSQSLYWLSYRGCHPRTISLASGAVYSASCYFQSQKNAWNSTSIPPYIFVCSTLRVFPAVKVCGHRSNGEFRKTFPPHAWDNDVSAPNIVSNVSFCLHNQWALGGMPCLGSLWLYHLLKPGSLSLACLSLSFLLNESWNLTSLKYCLFCQPTQIISCQGTVTSSSYHRPFCFETRIWKQKKGNKRTASSYVITSLFFTNTVLCVYKQEGKYGICRFLSMKTEYYRQEVRYSVVHFDT
jgi:hypothetical protein